MTISLDFQPASNGSDYVARHGAFTVRAVRDNDAECPWTAWDCEPPILVNSGSNSGLDAYGDNAEEIRNPLQFFSDGKLSRHWRAIAKELERDPDEIHREALDTQKHYGGRLVDLKREAFSEILDDFANGNATDYFTALSRLFELAGIATLDGSSRGYVQSQWADVLAVALPSWVKASGAPKSSHARQLAYAVKLFGFWAWGDVYGYVISEAGEETGDSCFGFYGDDFAESGLSEAAGEALAHLVAARIEREAVALEESRPDMYQPRALEPAR